MAKNLILSLLVLASALGSTLFADDLTEFLRQAESNIDLQAMQGILEGKPGPVESQSAKPEPAKAESQPDKKCPRGGCLTNATIEDEDPSLMVFISFSVPEASWKEHSQVLERLNGAFILRGLPDNSFSEFARKIKHLREAGINAPILIDDEAFAKYRVHHAPTIVLKKGQIHDKVTGNLQIPEALTIFARHGQTASLAKQYTATLLATQTQTSQNSPKVGGD